MRAVAVAAALTSTSLRERCREPGEEAAAGVLLWAALAGGERTALQLHEATMHTVIRQIH